MNRLLIFLQAMIGLGFFLMIALVVIAGFSVLAVGIIDNYRAKRNKRTFIPFEALLYILLLIAILFLPILFYFWNLDYLMFS